MSELSDAVANAVSLLPVGVKSDLGVHFIVKNGNIRVSGTDGYTFVTQLVSDDVSWDIVLDRYLSKAIVKDLPKDLTSDDLLKALDESGVHQTNSPILPLIEMATSPLPGESHTSLSFSPDRVKKLGALKPSGLAFHGKFGRTITDVDYVQFTYGSACGVFTLLEEPQCPSP